MILRAHLLDAGVPRKPRASGDDPAGVLPDDDAAQ